jgi:hypothetical protein
MLSHFGEYAHTVSTSMFESLDVNASDVASLLSVDQRLPPKSYIVLAKRCSSECTASAA